MKLMTFIIVKVLNMYQIKLWMILKMIILITDTMGEWHVQRERDSIQQVDTLRWLYLECGIRCVYAILDRGIRRVTVCRGIVHTPRHRWCLE
jgi:hypothetical protein